MESLVGKILIAPPIEADASRVESVILITNEYNGYYIGLRLNNQSKMSVTELAAYSGYKLSTCGYVFAGGSHSLNSFSMLHSPEWTCTNTVQINEFVSISSSTDVIKRFINNDMPDKWKMFLGINKWIPGQLEAEISGNLPYTHDVSWCVVSSTAELVFDTSSFELWDMSLSRCAEEFAKETIQ
jgi:putative AlgH/UPF0301 family transcriptional regulator